MIHKTTVRTTHPITGAEVDVKVTDFSEGRAPFRFVVWGGWAELEGKTGCAWRTEGVRCDRTNAENAALAEARKCNWSDWAVTEVLG
jgi:hypothetical protein